MKNIFVLLAIYSCVFLYAEQSADNVIDSISEGTRKDSTSSDLNPNKNRAKRNYNEEVAYGLFVRYEQEEASEIKPIESLENFAFDVKAEKEKQRTKYLKERLALLKAEKEKYKKENFIKYGHGYCYLDKEIVVERLANYAYLSCNLNYPIGKVTLAISLVPEFYGSALIGNPLYVQKGEKRIPIKNGVVMTKDKNSINLANLVNDRKLQKMVATGLYKSAQIATVQAQAYLQERIAARQIQETIVSPGGVGGSVVSTTTNRIAPPKEDYYLAATFAIVGELSKIIGESFVKDLPFTFKAFKNSVYYVDLQFSEDGNMEGYKMKQDNLFKKEPTFNSSEESQITEQLPVLNNHVIENRTNINPATSTTIQKKKKTKKQKIVPPKNYPIQNRDEIDEITRELNNITPTKGI